MASNAYGRAGAFELGPDLVRIAGQDNDEIGFAYAVFERRESGSPVEIVIAYRGTETGLADWWFGNLLTRQNERGLRVFDDWRARHPGMPMTVTGHSLGGGIATRVSLCRPDVRSFVFNSSPRFRRCAERHRNPRVSIVEYGEILKVPRIFGREPHQTYTSIGCMRGRNPVAQHGMRPLAECLTRIAALDSPAARESLARNGLPPIGPGEDGS